ncbi:MAG TPA: P-loop NTPase fold protein [Spirochaetota bacterium]|nr:P-loop NTPase fold protein [Spirochaetota bacterium]
MDRFNDSPFNKTQKSEIQNFDKIELATFADSIADFIMTCETPMTIGLQGDWGTGKTSLMNMIKCYIPEKAAHKIEINTWHYSMFRQDEYLGIVIVKALVEQLANRFAVNNKGFASNLKNLGNMIGAVMQKTIAVAKSVEIGIPVVGGLTINDAAEAIANKDDDSLKIENLSEVLLAFKQQFTKLIEENVSAKNERIYFFVDDLDRIKPLKAIEVLETLKNFMDVEGCIFVLAVDYEIVQLGITEKFGKNIQLTSGKSFFDKIIQLPFTMPTSSYDIGKYLTSLLQGSNFYSGDLEKEQNKTDLNYFVDITEVTIGRNPRSIKRAINYATLLEKIRAKHATRDTKKNKDMSKLLYTIVCMQIAWPEIFDYFILHPTTETVKNLEDWDYLNKLPQAKKLFARVNNADEVRDNISAFFDILYSVIDVKEKDGIITDEELEPLLDVLQLVKLTSEKNILKNENPLKRFNETLTENTKAKKIPEIENFFSNVWMKSVWVTNDSMEYKKAGERYITMVYNRKQIGSLVTIKRDPFVIRLKEDSIKIIDNTTFDNNEDIIKSMIKPLENGDSLTGIGDTMIDITPLLQIPEKNSIGILNTIYAGVIKTINQA